MPDITRDIYPMPAFVTFAVERARAHGGGDVSDPADTPWNTRDVNVTDPDGYRLVYTARRPEGERDEAFGARITELAREQGLSSAER